MMNRDPVSGLTQRRSLQNEEETEVKTDDIPEESKIERSFTEKPTTDIPTEIVDDVERAEIELAIKRSLEDQQEASVEQKNHKLSDAAEHSSSDSDGNFCSSIHRNASIVSRF